MSSPEPTDEKLERFARALRNAEESRHVFVPPTLDEAILKQARNQFASKPEPRTFRFWNWLALAGAAALIAIAIFILPRSKFTATTAREDINRDGQVDILDAFALAKSIESRQTSQALDQNGDGKLDDSDVRAIASVAVRLDRKS
jgi:RecB family exonuclease